MKIIAKTTGPFALLDSLTRDLLEEHTPSLVTMTNFIESRIAKGEIKVLASNLPNDADPEEFKTFLQDSGNVTLAVASFVSKFEDQSGREALEARARELGVEFRSNISDEKLAARVKSAEEKR